MISTLFAVGLFLAGVPFMAVSGLLAWDDIRARELGHRDARRWEGV